MILKTERRVFVLLLPLLVALLLFAPRALAAEDRTWNDSGDKTASALGAVPGDTIVIGGSADGALTIDVDDVTITGGAGSNAYIVVDAAVTKLTLQELTIDPGFLSAKNALTVEGDSLALTCTGEVRLKGSSMAIQSDAGYHGILAAGALQISGDGQLIATGGNGGNGSTNGSDGGAGGHGIAGNIIAAGNVQVTGTGGGGGKGNVGANKPDGYGGTGGTGIKGGVTISDNAAVTGIGGKGGDSYLNKFGGAGGIGIHLTEDMQLNGGTVAAEAGDRGSGTYARIYNPAIHQNLKKIEFGQFTASPAVLKLKDRRKINYTITKSAAPSGYCFTVDGAQQAAGDTLLYETADAGINNEVIITLLQRVATPVATPADEGIAAATEVTLTAQSGATIYYTLDGSDPITNPNGTRQEYNNTPITVNPGDTLKAFAQQTGLGNSEVLTKVYTQKITESVGYSTSSPLYTRHTLTDRQTGVTVTGQMTSYARLTVRERVLHAEGACPACDEIRARQAAGEVLVLYDISISGGYTGGLEVGIPVGSTYNGQTVTILHCINGVLESVTCTVQNGVATGMFQKLSPFAVVKDIHVSVPENIVVDPPKTGDAPTGGAIGIALMLGALAACMAARRKHRSANR